MVRARLLKWKEQPEVLLYWVHVASCVRPHQSAVRLIDCIRRLIGHSAGGWISPPAASPQTSILQQNPSSTQTSFLFSIQRLISQKTDGQKACEKTTVLYRAMVIPYLLDVYIFSIKKKYYVVDECSRVFVARVEQEILARRFPRPHVTHKVHRV